MTSPTSRTLATLRKEGYLPEVCERWLPGVNVRRDLYHFGDVIACNPKTKVILIVQCTSLANVSSRLKKATALPALAAWLTSGGSFEVWGWGKAHDGKWFVRRIGVTLEQMQGVELTPPRPRRKARRAEATLFDGLEN